MSGPDNRGTWRVDEHRIRMREAQALIVRAQFLMDRINVLVDRQRKTEITLQAGDPWLSAIVSALPLLQDAPRETSASRSQAT